MVCQDDGPGIGVARRPKPQVVGVWALAGDEPTGLYLVSKDATGLAGPWVADHPLDEVEEAHDVAEALLAARDCYTPTMLELVRRGRVMPPVRSRVPVLHSPGWLPLRRWPAPAPSVATTLTFAAVLEVPELVVDAWPDAVGFADLVERYGPPATHAADRPPEHTRPIDVFYHLLRHVALLRLYAATEAAKLPPAVAHHVAPLEPALANLYAATHAG
jgi:hypothetical protein